MKLLIRQLLKTPGFTVIAVLSIAFGIGASMAVFSVVNAVLLKTLPVPRPQELRLVHWTGQETRVSSYDGKPNESFSYPAYANLKSAANQVAEVIGSYPLEEVVARVGSEFATAPGRMVSENFFDGLQVEPFPGQTLTKENSTVGMPVVILLATVAVGLTCIGLYGLMAYNVVRTTNEIGIRMALDARREQILGQILREALILSGIGLGIGLPVTIGLLRLLRNQLYGVSPVDPLTPMLAMLSLMVVAALAAWLPARRAAGINPMEARRAN